MTANAFPDRSTSAIPSPGEPPRPEQQSWQPAPPAPAADVPYRRLLRSSRNKVLGGVCGGLAEYTDTDPLLWRVGVVALGVMGGGILVFPLLWLLVAVADPAGSGTSGLHEKPRRGRAPRS